jgi:hypothetical protein
MHRVARGLAATEQGWLAACFSDAGDSMQHKQLPEQEEHDGRATREAAHGARDQLDAVANDSPRDDLDGQLGPDELPDAAEVLMSREAKLHRG